jgi:nucleotide-binding universal stress UspA family protein
VIVAQRTFDPDAAREERRSVTNHKAIVVGVDDSPEARAALRWGADQARRSAARLRVVHAFQPRHLAGILGMAKLQPDDEWRAEAESALADIVSEEVSEFDGIELEAVTAQDGPAAAVLSAAEDAALVVVGSRGRGMAASALLGSVSSSILRHARCPVVVVPSAVDQAGC